MASTISGINITHGLSWAWCIASSPARGSPWKGAERQRADPHRHIGDRGFAPEAAHAAHVLLAAHRMDDRPAAQEQQPLEEGMREEVKDCGAVGRDAGGGEHVAELAASRI